MLPFITRQPSLGTFGIPFVIPGTEREVAVWKLDQLVASPVPGMTSLAGVAGEVTSDE